VLQSLGLGADHIAGLKSSGIVADA